MENSAKPCLLIVDDEQDILDILKFNFTSSGYNVLTATSAESALQSDFSAINLIILDIMMSGMSGTRMAMMLKENPDTADIPIIFLSALDSKDNIIDGLRLGIDDYVTKPFSVQELVLRVQAILRRSSRRDTGKQPAEVAQGLHIDNDAKLLMIDGRPIPLTRTEFALLSVLSSSPGRVYSRQQLLDTVWPEGVIVNDRSVDVGITRLRKKIGRFAPCIVSRPGFGYCFEYEKINH